VEPALVVEQLLPQAGMAPDKLIQGGSEAALAAFDLQGVGFDEPAEVAQQSDPYRHLFLPRRLSTDPAPCSSPPVAVPVLRIISRHPRSRDASPPAG